LCWAAQLHQFLLSMYTQHVIATAQYASTAE